MEKKYNKQKFEIRITISEHIHEQITNIAEYEMTQPAKLCKPLIIKFINEYSDNIRAGKFTK
jgi:hypothetical protein